MPWLAILIAIPLLGAALLLGTKPLRAREVALGVAVFELATVGHVTRLLVQTGPMAEHAQAFWRLRLDGLSAPLVLLTALLAIVAVASSWRIADRPSAHFAALLALEAAVIGVFLADDLLLFYAMWEAVLVPMYFLIGVWGHERRKHAAMKFFVYTFAGSALMLVGFIIAALAAGTTSLTSVTGAVPAPYQAFVLVLVLAGMLVKIPVVPFHTWLPDAHVEAPTAGSIMLAGVLLKMGGYGLLRIAAPIAPAAFVRAEGVLVVLGVVGIVYGALMALAQTDLKRLVAYSSVSHMGFVVLATALGTPLARQAAVLVMVSHGLVAALSFWLVGALYERTHTRDMSTLGGMARTSPVWGGLFVFAALASLGLPGLSGFPGEALTVIEAVGELRWWWMVLVAIGIVLAGAYNLLAVRRVAHGPQLPAWADIEDLSAGERATAALLVVPVVILGLVPGLVTALASPALDGIAKGVAR